MATVVDSQVAVFGALCLMLQFFIIPFLARKCLGELKPMKMFDVTECSMSLIMSALVSVCSCVSLANSEDIHEYPWFQSACQILICYLLSHMLFCIYHEGFLSPKIRVWIGHHTVSIIAISILLTMPIENVLVANVGSVFMELSNPFTNAVFLLQHVGYNLDNSILFVILCALWIATFILCRLIPMPYIFYIYVDCYLLDNSVAMCTDKTFTLPLLLMFTTISTLNLFWFSQMMSGCVSFLFENNKTEEGKSKTKSPLDDYKTE
ncbi:uncharacterized protein LOC134840691 [Symsagittifera roscoffensis]|uniref:uncharacterized protein LOC134840691 n=1 Tax=Symsagittifera roscoffensis TaxID=84072 RepID=UPI00307BE347